MTLQNFRILQKVFEYTHFDVLVFVTGLCWWESQQPVLVSIFVLHSKVFQWLVFTQLHYLPFAYFSLNISTFCYRVLQHYSVSVLYLLFFLVFGTTLGVVPVTIRSYIVDNFWFKCHFIGYIIYKRLV